MASGDVLFVSEYLDFPSYQAINDALAAVDVGAFHDDAVLHLGVGDGGVVSDACVGTDEGVWSDLAAVAYDHGSPDGGVAVDYGSLSYPDAVGYGGGIFHGSAVVGFQVVEDELIRARTLVYSIFQSDSFSLTSSGMGFSVIRPYFGAFLTT